MLPTPSANATECRRTRVLLVFVDGIGLGSADPGTNPLASPGALPRVEELIGAPLTRTAAPCVVRSVDTDVVLRALDATLGIDGLPQSATGQATLFTGRNAAQFMGRHVAAFPGPRLREWMLRETLLSVLVREGASVTFANTFSPGYHLRLAQRRIRESVTVVCARDAGIRLRGVSDLRGAHSLTWDIEGDLFDVRERSVSAHCAGEHLARLTLESDFTFYETFLTDLVAHGRIEMSHAEVLRRLDELLGGVLDGLVESPGCTVVLTSDHGNFEEREHRRHTRNPVPLLVIGPGCGEFSECTSLADVAPAILRVLSSTGRSVALETTGPVGGARKPL